MFLYVLRGSFSKCVCVGFSEMPRSWSISFFTIFLKSLDMRKLNMRSPKGSPGLVPEVVWAASGTLPKVNHAFWWDSATVLCRRNGTPNVWKIQGPLMSNLSSSKAEGGKASLMKSCTMASSVGSRSMIICLVTL